LCVICPILRKFKISVPPSAVLSPEASVLPLFLFCPQLKVCSSSPPNKFGLASYLPAPFSSVPVLAPDRLCLFFPLWGLWEVLFAAWSPFSHGRRRVARAIFLRVPLAAPSRVVVFIQTSFFSPRPNAFFLKVAFSPGFSIPY